MGLRSYPEPRIRAALFVDFDNIFISLDKFEPAAAEAFANAPAQWLEWLEKELDSGGNGKRTILLRRCYLNPNAFYRFRNNFVKAGFQVVDCPSFTARNKNGADILMVIDILDALQHETRFDEFIILSGDSDFRPVILRLRAHDRRSVIVQVGAVAPAYRAACDYIVDEDEFVEEMLGVREGRNTQTTTHSAPMNMPQKPGAPRPQESSYDQLLEEVATKVLDRAHEDGDLMGSDLPRIYKSFPDFRDSHWFGFRSLRRLTEHIISLRPELQLIEDDDASWYVALREQDSPAAEKQRNDGAGQVSHDDDDQLAQEIIAFVENEVERSEKPVHMATVAHRLKRQFGDAIFKTNWAGAGSFRALLDEFPDKRFSIANVKSGVLYDPDRHPEPRERSLDELLTRESSELQEFIPRIYKATGGVVPALMPREYATVFRAIAQEVSEHGFSLFHTAKAVQDLCFDIDATQKDQGREISLKAIRSILKGLAITDRELLDAPSQQGVTVEALVAAYRDNIVRLCGQAEEELTDRDFDLLEQWIQAEEPVKA